MRRRDFLIGAMALSAQPLLAQASTSPGNIPFSSDRMLERFKKEYLGRIYATCMDLPDSGTAQTLSHRLTGALAERGYAQFSADIAAMADEDFAQGRLQIVDGWLLPEIEVELLA